jgi:hypothetical protein
MSNFKSNCRFSVFAEPFLRVFKLSRLIVHGPQVARVILFILFDCPDQS